MNEKIYRSWITFCSLPIDSYYRFRDLFQILPTHESAPSVPYHNAHHPALIEYCFDKPVNDTSNPDWVIENYAAHERVNEILRVMTVFTAYHFFTYNHEQAWFIPVDETIPESLPKYMWGQMDYSYPEFKTKINEFSSPDSPMMKIIEAQKYYNRGGVELGL